MLHTLFFLLSGRCDIIDSIWIGTSCGLCPGFSRRFLLLAKFTRLSFFGVLFFPQRFIFCHYFAFFLWGFFLCQSFTALTPCFMVLDPPFLVRLILSHLPILPAWSTTTSPFLFFFTVCLVPPTLRVFDFSFISFSS